VVSRRLWSFLALPAAVAGVAAIALTTGMGGDYPGPACPGCDYAAPPIAALLHLDLSRLFAVQPMMGSFSLLLRVPAALVAKLVAGGDLLWQYRLGAFVCLLGPAVLGVALVRRMHGGVLPKLAVLALCVANPLTFAALHWGHPEEPLAGALCVGAVLLAGDRRPLAAGVVLGLAFATKPWAWLALPAVLLAAAGCRRTILAAALGVGGALTLPMLLGDPSRFLHQVGAFSVVDTGVTPFNVWWGFAHQGGEATVGGSAGATWSIPATLASITHPLVILVALALSALAFHRRRPPQPERALQLLALLLLLRCLLDPLSISYHHAPFLLALIASEAVRRSWLLPFASLSVSAIVWAMTRYVLPLDDPDLAGRVYLGWSLPAALYLGMSALGWPRGELTSPPWPAASSSSPLRSARDTTYLRAGSPPG